MTAFRSLLIVAASCSVASNVLAQSMDGSSPEPTRWTAQPKTIATPLAEPAPHTSAFPSLSRPAADSVEAAKQPKPASKISGPAVTVASSLAVVLGLFAALVWMTRRFGSRGIHQGAISRDVLQSLGTSPIDARTRVTLLRCGNRILVLAQTAGGVHPLAEITDPEEVRHLTASCLGDAKGSFATTLRSIEGEPVQPGFAGSGDRPPVTAKRSRLFATA